MAFCLAVVILLTVNHLQCATRTKAKCSPGHASQILEKRQKYILFALEKRKKTVIFALEKRILSPIKKNYSLSAKPKLHLMKIFPKQHNIHEEEKTSQTTNKQKQP